VPMVLVGRLYITFEFELEGDPKSRFWVALFTFQVNSYGKQLNLKQKDKSIFALVLTFILYRTLL
jgi:hypothetical protein